MNKIKRSLAILLIIGLVVTGLPLNIAKATESNTANDENTNITVVDDNQINSNTATDDEQDEEVIEEDTKTTDEGTNVAESQVDSADIQLNYIYVESPKVTTPGEQNIVVSLGDASDEITNVKLNYQKDNGEIEFWDSDDSVEGVFLFTKEFDETESGIYEVVSISYEVNRDIKEIKLNEIGQDVHFGVNIDVESASENVMIVQNDGSLIEKTDANTQDEMKDDAIVTTDNSNMVQLSNNVKMAMQSQSTAKTMSSKSDEIVIVIDPGHDSDKHAGARGVNGLKEEELTLEIAKACKTELEKYSGVKVYLTRTTSACPFPNSTDNIDDIVKRVAYANSLGADAFVSIHLNSFNGSASGAEVYYYTTNVDGKTLAQKIQTELSSLGLNNRGIKKGDAYAVINNAERYGFPGIIVEHAFIDNKGDVNKVLSTNAGRQKLGVADAKGIVAAFGLTKCAGRWETINGKTYYYDKDGNQAFGSTKIDGEWYRFDLTTGAMITGWFEVSGRKCYYNKEGVLQFGSQKINGEWYRFDDSGYMITGWAEVNGKKCYYNEDGVLQFGSQYIDGEWYYFDQSGYLKTGWITENGKKCYYTTEGKRAHGSTKIDGEWYCFDNDGYMVTGLYKANGKTSYYSEKGILQYGSQKINGEWYRFDDSGYMITGWAEVNGKKCYYNEDGVLQFGSQYIDGEWYYFDQSGYLINEYGFPIASKSDITAKQLAEFYISKKKTFPTYYKEHDKEATTLEKFCQIYIDEANAEGINVEVAFCQAMLETGWLQYGGAVTIDKFNFAGIGAVDSNPSEGAARFNSVREGIRAQIQHLKAYANDEPLNNPQIDPRFHLVKRGSAPYVEMLGGRWASDTEYGYKIVELMKQI